MTTTGIVTMVEAAISPFQSLVFWPKKDCSPTPTVRRSSRDRKVRAKVNSSHARTKENAPVAIRPGAVSYTHLTLPTNREV